jgi:hypothetical protein
MTPLAVEATPAPAPAPAPTAPAAVGRTHSRTITASHRHEALATLRLVLVSRALIWIVGCTAVMVLGTSAADIHAFDPHGVSTSLGPVGNVLAAPAVRWDAIWYLQIAHHGYTSARDAGFFPLYPLLVRAVSMLTVSTVLAGILVSVAALCAGLEFVRRLTTLELGERAAGPAIALMAFAPLAVYLSAVYTEALFVALSAATFYAARRGRWALVGIAGGLAALSRVGGVVLIVPVLILFFYGPRSDRPPGPVTAWWKPRYGITAAMWWTLLIPGAVGLFSLYLAFRGLGATATVHAQQLYWSHQVVLPFTGVWDGAKAAWHQASLSVHGIQAPSGSADAILQLVVLAATIAGLVGVFRRLPAAYGAYVTIAALQVLSVPTVGDPLKGFDRYASMWFPLFMWAGAWAVEHRAERRVLAVSALLLVVFTVQFATWSVVGSSSF